MKAFRFIASLAGVLVLAGLMPTRESLWIDETSTHLYASEPTFHSFEARLRAENGSEAQMPLGMAAFWLWEKMAGSSEWGLRSLNIVWTLVAAGVLFLTGRRLGLPALPFWLIVQPFLWYYANEARPYVMQIAGSALLLHALTACVQDRGRGTGWAWALTGGAFLTTGASLLGALPLAVVGAILIACFIAWRTLPERRTIGILGLGVIGVSHLGAYYLLTLLRGAGGAKLWNVGLVNAGFAGYELTGFLGLGPARLEIREAAQSGGTALIALFKPYWAGLSLLALLHGLLLLPLARGSDGKRRLVLGLTALYAALAGALLLIASMAVGFPIWGRHLAFVLPAWTLLVAGATDRLTGPPPRPLVSRLVPALLALLLAVSSLGIRFSERHRKDDYRRAAAIARGAAGRAERTGWAADVRTARYYGVSFAALGSPGTFEIRAADLDRFESDMAGSLPGKVILSKPDLFDPAGRLAQWLASHRYECLNTFPGFTVWIRPPP